MKFKMKLERYNQIIWAMLGTGALVAVAIGIIAAVVSLFQFGRPGVPVEVVEDPSAPRAGHEIKADVCLPIDIDDTPYQLIRVAVDRIVIKGKALTAERVKKLGSSYSDEGGAAGCGDGGTGYMSVTGSVLIRDKRSDALRLLISQNAMIQHMEYPVRRGKVREDGEADSAFPPPGTLYWEIGLADTNGDGVLSSRDDIGAYLSDVDGGNLVRISPPGSRVLEKTYDEARKQLTLKIVKDTDGDKSLDESDAASIIEVSVPQRRILGTLIENATWQERVRDLKPMNAAP